MDTLPSSPVRGREQTRSIHTCLSNVRILGLSRSCGCQLNTEEYIEVILILDMV